MKTIVLPVTYIFLLCLLLIRHPAVAQFWELEYNGSGFTDIFVLDDNQAWAIGDRGHIVYTNDGGENWSHRITIPTGLGLLGIWGVSATEIWAVGYSGYIMKFDGNEWARQDSPVTETIAGIWGSDASNIWAVSLTGTILYYNGTNWAVQSSTGTGLRAIWGASASNIWVVGVDGAIFNYDGNNWVPQASGTNNTLLRVGGSDAANVWAGGLNGTILKYDGVSWQTQASGTSAFISGIYAASPTDVWAAANFDAILHFDGNIWTQHTPLNFAVDNLKGTGPDNIWAVSSPRARILRYTEETWQPRFFSASSTLNSTWGFDENTVWVVGDNRTIFHFDGARWNLELFNVSGNLYGVWGSSPNQVWAVGESGRIMEYNGSSWMVHSEHTWPQLNAIWGADAENIWAVGDNGVIIKYDGNSWNLQNMSIFQKYNSVWGSSPNDVWAVGGGNIARYNGTIWTVNPAPPSLAGNLVAVSGTAANDVWVVNEAGNVWTFNGSQWTSRGSAGILFSKGLWVKDASNAWVAGLSRISHYDGTTWSVQALNEQSFIVRSIWGTDSKLWATGSYSSIWSNNISPVQVKDHPGKTSDNYVLYPNPTQDLLFIAGWEGEPVSYVLFDATGRPVLRGVLHTNHISLAGLPPGLYLLSLQNRNGRMLKKLVKG